MCNICKLSVGGTDIFPISNLQMNCAILVGGYFFIVNLHPILVYLILTIAKQF